jgi:phosphatidylserine/phosphatidylglycerophosphate/cardiolipin synthase-like enzyme
MFSLRRTPSNDSTALVSSHLYDDQSFYEAFTRDIKSARSSIIIESPFVTTRRFGFLYPMLESAAGRGVRIIINTRDPATHEPVMREQAAQAVGMMQTIGVTVLFTANHHRKLAILDHTVLWEGSLNILSQNDSCEIMRRIVSPTLAKQMIQFTRLAEWYTQEQL